MRFYYKGFGSDAWVDMDAFPGMEERVMLRGDCKIRPSGLMTMIYSIWSVMDQMGDRYDDKDIRVYRTPDYD